MKTEITIGELYARTNYYSGDIVILDENGDEEDSINFTVVEQWDENSGNSFAEDVTFQLDLPEGIDPEELKQQIIDKFNE